MIFFLVSCLGITCYIKIINDVMIQEMFKELGQNPKYYRNTYQLPRTLNPLSTHKNHD